jgi:hypothetical protein
MLEGEAISNYGKNIFGVAKTVILCRHWFFWGSNVCYGLIAVFVDKTIIARNKNAT